MSRLTRCVCVVVWIIALFTTRRATAQETQPAVIGGPATRPFASRPSTGPSQITLNFKDVPLDTVLDYFSRQLGFEILKDGPIDTRVQIISMQPVSPDEAIMMLSTALRVNGFAVVRDGRLLHISSRDKAKKANVPVHFGNNPDDIPETEELITQIIPIDNINAVKLQDNLKTLIASDADLTANEGSNSIIITDTSANIHRIAKIISQLDSHEATTAELRITQLKHANAAAIAKLIDTLFKPAPANAAGPQNAQQAHMMAQNGGQPGGPDQNGAQGGGPEKHGQTVIVTADDRTNSLLVMASAGTQKVIDQVIAQLDTNNPNPAPPTNLQFFPLKYAAADATAKLVNDLFKGSATDSIISLIYGDGSNQEDKKVAVNATFDDRTNTVIVTAPPEKLKDVASLIERLDKSPQVSQELRVIPLKHADAYNVAKLVEDMFEPKKDDQSNNNPFRFFIISPIQQDAVRGVKINVTSDERTNTLLVSAPTPVLDSIQKVVEQLDTDPATEDTMFIYHLRNGQAQHLSYTLNVLFGNVSTQKENNQQNGPNGQYNPNQQNPFGNQSEQSNGPPGNSNNNSGNRSGANNRNAQNNRPGQGGAAGAGGPGALTPLANELTGKAFVVPEPDTNSLLVTTASKYEPQVRKIIDDLDKPVRQVLIKVLVAEVTHDNGDQFGVDFSVLNQRTPFNQTGLSQTITSQGPSNTTTINGASQNTVATSGNTSMTNTNTFTQETLGSKGGISLGAAAAAAASPSGLVATLLEDNVMATIQALQSEGKLDVLSRPYILTSDNQEANIFIGEEDPYVTDTRVETTGQLVNTIDYRQTGVILDVTPHVNETGQVVMDVNPQVSQKQPGGVTITQGVISPIYSTRSAFAHVAVPDGATIVIGGMMQDQVNSQVNKVPILGDLPLVGVLFQNTSSTKTKTELLFFLTPHVAQLPDNLQHMAADEQKALKLVPSAVGPGVFDEHMKGMRIGGPSTTQSSEPVVPISPVLSVPLN